ncbi:DUF674 family protein [Quillaja saponaria]|uniref:DUF674 family protein n=1 Tax=Quillaja saponaria TaxID=32244 RepID=A0AAD7PC88_QUISA|nr:DUF674 family protein [Quillaja saponaria]
MESQSKTTFPLRVLVDKEKRRVVAAEATMNFVDILFGFLALPMGTIVRLVEAEQGQHPAVIGCMNNLYNSVEKLGDEVFVNDVRKQMLIRPHNPCDSLCRKLKINVDDSEDVEFYVCISCNYYSTFPNEICTCGQPMIKRKMADHNPGNGVFLRGSPLFLIFDDLKIIPSTPGRSTKLFLQHGYKDLSHLLDINISVGFKEINSLLKYALTSKHPLTSLFLPMKSVEIKSVDPCLCHDQQQQVNT